MDHRILRSGAHLRQHHLHHRGGTHEEGFRAALTSLVNRYAREKNILKDKDENLSGDDVREGLTAVVSVKLTTPQFEGQTKTKLGNSEAKTFVQRVMTDKLGDWFDSHPSEAKNIIQKAIEASRARLAAKKARENTRRKSIFESAGMPDKLRIASPTIPKNANCSSWRATPQAAPQFRDATRSRRPSCRCEAKSLTPSVQASTA